MTILYNTGVLSSVVADSLKGSFGVMTWMFWQSWLFTVLIETYDTQCANAAFPSLHHDPEYHHGVEIINPRVAGKAIYVHYGILFFVIAAQ